MEEDHDELLEVESDHLHLDGVLDEDLGGAGAPLVEHAAHDAVADEVDVGEVDDAPVQVLEESSHVVLRDYSHVC